MSITPPNVQLRDSKCLEHCTGEHTSAVSAHKLFKLECDGKKKCMLTMSEIRAHVSKYVFIEITVQTCA